MNLDIATMIDHLLLPDRERWEQQKRLAQVTANMQALGVLDEHGRQIAGEVIRKLRGIDGLFIYYALMNADLQYPLARELVEFLIDHDVIQKILGRAADEEKREWCRNRLRERRREEPQVSWEDVEEEYERAFPRELTPVEKLHSDFLGKLPHPELHGGRRRKAIWAEMEDESLGFMDFVEKHGLAAEEGNLFSYLARVMKFARMLFEATTLSEFENLATAVRERLSVVDDRVLAELG